MSFVYHNDSPIAGMDMEFKYASLPNMMLPVHTTFTGCNEMLQNPIDKSSVLWKMFQ